MRPSTRRAVRRLWLTGRPWRCGVGTISWGYPPTLFHGFFAPEGTTDHLLLVDAEVGVILRVAARLEDREVYVAEVTEIVFDEDFSEGTFRLELPGVEFRSIDC
jgi:hypothetical protein